MFNIANMYYYNPYFNNNNQQRTSNPPVNYQTQYRVEPKNQNLNSILPFRSSFKNRLIQLVIDVLVIGVIFSIFGIVYSKLDPKIRSFHCSETDIFFPYKKDTIPFYAVGLYGTIGPVLVILIVELLNARLLPFQNKFPVRVYRYSMFIISSLHALLLFALGISLTVLLTEIGKRWIGRLRPHFIAVCNPDFSTVVCSTNGGGAGNVIYNSIDTGGSFCRGSASEVEEARLSFPSGHSSYSTYTMLFLILYIQARLVLYKLRFIKPLIQLAAFIAAYVTSISRISDYHHRGSDVIGGIVLGGIIAVFTGFIIGRVLWRYGAETDYLDFDLKPRSTI